MFHLLSDFFPKEPEKSKPQENQPELKKKLTPKPRKKRFNYKEKNWRKDVIYIEILILILFVFFPVLFYLTGHMEFDF